MIARKTDDNQSKIVEALRSIGATVQILSAVGHGCPDIAVGIFRRNYFFEIKNPDQPKSAQSLTADEAIWHNGWKGRVAIIRNVEEALEAIK
jgi:hypothetical protein